MACTSDKELGLGSLLVAPTTTSGPCARVSLASPLVDGDLEGGDGGGEDIMMDECILCYVLWPLLRSLFALESLLIRSYHNSVRNNNLNDAKNVLCIPTVTTISVAIRYFDLIALKNLSKM